SPVAGWTTGPGYGMRERNTPLAETGLKMTGADVSREMIRGRSENRTGCNGCRLAEALPFPDGSFDGATMVLCAHPMHNIGKAFAAAFSGPDDWFQLFTGAEGRFWLREYSPGPWRRPAGRCRRSSC